jgi:hypothetical protein
MQEKMHCCDKKPTFLDLRERYGLGIISLSDKSGVAPSVIYSMLLYRPVAQVNAISVLSSLGELVGVDYSLEDVDVALLKE